MSRVRWFFAGCWLLSAAPAPAQELPAPATAIDEQTLARAKELFSNGSMLYAEGLYAEAIVAWKESYRLSGRPPLLYNIANAYERMGDYANAIAMLNQYRAVAPIEEQPTLERRIYNLELRHREQLGRFVVPEPALMPEPDSGSSSRAPVVRRAVGGGLFAAGLASVGTGTAFALIAQRAATDASAGCKAVADGRVCIDSARPEIAANRRDVAISVIGLAAGALMSAGGVTLWVTRPAPDLEVRADGVRFGLSWALR